MIKRNLIGQGRTAEIYEWDDDKIIKLYKKGISKKAIENEYNISMRLYEKGMPVVKVYDLIKLNGRYGVVYGRVFGQTMMNVIASKPWKITRESRRLAVLHKEIHAGIEEQIPSEKSILKQNIAAVEMLDEDQKDKLFRYIEELPDDNKLCHGDFHPDNILIDGEKAVVIDWMTATRGNPLSDVARTTIMLKYGQIPEDKSALEKTVMNLMRKKLLKEYTKKYLEISEKDIKDIEQWELPIAAARLTEWIPDNEKKVLLDFINTEV